MDLFGGLEALCLAAGQRRPIQITRLRPGREYAQLGARQTILTGLHGSGGSGVLTTEPALWFRDSQFLMTYSPFTKE
jgi:hypothetical protein